ncbi:MAG: bifunctional SulP family inorganic anion transporter/carbonic anhydrase [Corynebacteriales bacterium]|nr:bifunctional SulP family inorganic anion transporter/carbonic anhydrase [Mycobacteriales bacterium]
MPTNVATPVIENQPAKTAGIPPGKRFRDILVHDLPASLVVLLIAIPLSLGIALASGAPLWAGLIAAVVGGVVVGAIAGAPLQVTGPAAGLIVIIADLIIRYGWPATCFIVVAAGAVQIVLGLARLGRIALSFSPALIHGMLAGLGVIIIIGQLHVLLGGEPSHSVLANVKELPAQFGNGHTEALLLGVIAVGVMLGWPRIPAVRKVPAPLVAVLLTTLIAILTESAAPRVDLPKDPLSGFVGPTVPEGSFSGILVAVLTVALVGSVASLLTAVAVDKMHGGPRAQLNKELVAQGTGNMLSGLLGGLPVTGVIVRSHANVEAGARTRASTMLHGLWIGIAMLVGTAALSYIPLSALAAILIVVGLRLVDTAQIKTLARHHELAVYLVTITGVVFIGLVEGILLGTAAAIIRALYRITHSVVRVSQPEPGRWKASVHGTLVFLGVGKLLRDLDRIPPGQHVLLELHTDFIDHAIFEAIRDWRASYQKQGGTVEIDEVHDSWFARSHANEPEHRKSLPAPLPRWFAPWASWQERAIVDDADGAMERGVREFEHRSSDLVRPFLEDLAEHGQKPQHLFITCADSRILPNLITSSGPGDLFCVRNVGNFVPIPGDDPGTGAAIEFAINNLNVSSIVVCGHSHCGAMAALAGEKPIDGELGQWLRHGKASTNRLKDLASIPVDLRSMTPPERLAVLNVHEQLQHVAQYPAVATKLENGELQLIGMYFQIATAQVRIVDLETGALRPA